MNLYINIAILVEHKEIKADIKIDILAILIRAASLIKAISDINIDIVKPTPAIKDTRNIDDQFIYDGFSAIPNKQDI